MEIYKHIITQLYSKEGRSFSYIGRLLNIDRQKVSKYIKELKLEKAHVSYLTPSNQKFLNKYKQKIKSMLDNNKTQKEIIAETGGTFSLLKTLYKHDVVLRKANKDYLKRMHDNARHRKNLIQSRSKYIYDFKDLPNEEWKPILNKEGYFISNYGRVKSYKKTYDKYNLLSQTYNNSTGYMYVSCAHKTLSVHRLVAIHFVDGRSEKKCYVNHIDRNKLNNKASNLEWCTQSENNKHAYTTGRKYVRKNKSDFKKVIYKDKYSFKTVASLARFLNKSETQTRRYLESPEKYELQIIYK